jgi:hypothetical protein
MRRRRSLLGLTVLLGCGLVAPVLTALVVAAVGVTWLSFWSTTGA